MKRRRKYLLASLGLLLILMAGGATWQSLIVRRDRSRYPPTGQLIDVGGRRLHVICVGQGEPTVVFEPSMFGGATSSEAARREISARTRVCSYDLNRAPRRPR